MYLVTLPEPIPIEDFTLQVCVNFSGLNSGLDWFVIGRFEWKQVSEKYLQILEKKD